MLEPKGECHIFEQIEIKRHRIFSRFSVSVLANSIRAVTGFIGALITVKCLKPSSYGDLAFLLGSFAALKIVLDMGSSNAFFTFISQKPRSRQYFALYFSWLTIQYIFSILLITLLLPQSILTKIWLGHPRLLILLAFTASFLQQQVWTTINQIAESRRQTSWIQTVNITISLLHLFVILLFCHYNFMSVNVIFILLILEYSAAAVLSYKLFPAQNPSETLNEVFDIHLTVIEFCKYCRPLVIYSCTMFTLEFYDKWLLQYFGGADQQGYYQLSLQFSAVSMLATSSILNIFWKEIAESHKQGDVTKVATIYLRVNRALVMFTAAISGFLIPWTKEIVSLFLGYEYLTAVPVLMIMFLYPIHQSMGQIGSVMLLATENPRSYMKVGIIISACFFPVSYLVLAPATSYIPGLGLGAIGMAWKSVVINIISVNVLAWFISKTCHCRYDWQFQIFGVSAVICAGFLGKLVSKFILLSFSFPERGTLVLSLSLTACLYFGTILLALWKMPWIIGFDRSEIRNGLQFCKSLSTK